MKKDLQFIAKHVTEWPCDSLDKVRLDRDGEICFSTGTVRYDFYPEGTRVDDHPSFVDYDYTILGYEYSREEWSTALVDRDHTLPKGERCWITCGPASILINSTAEGIIVDVWPAGNEDVDECVATLGVMYSDLESEED